jgi:hypothetical protein
MSTHARLHMIMVIIPYWVLSNYWRPSKENDEFQHGLKIGCKIPPAVIHTGVEISPSCLGTRDQHTKQHPEMQK